MAKTVLGVLCLLMIAVSSILFNNWSSIAYAQNDPNLIPWGENRLQFSDFQGVPDTFPDDYVGDRGDDFWAFTWTTTYYNWWPQITQNQPCMYTITAFDDNAYFYKNLSWVKSEHASDMSLLNHEQKHFDITEIQVRKINEIVVAEFLGKQFVCPSFSGQSQNDAINKKISQDLQYFLDQITQEMNQMNLDYDTQTNHGMDPQMQKEWDDYIANLLDYYEPFKDKQEIQLTQEETDEQDLTPTCPPGYPYLHSDGQCWNVPEGSQTTQTTKYLPYENKQYGFSIKYPSTWQKNEILEIDEDKPNRITIATFTSPSQTGLYMVGFAENDPTYRGLNDQQFLNKMKKEIANECQECQDTEFLSSDTVTHKNGYKVYYAVLTTTMVSAEGTLNPMLTSALIPDGNDLWLIALMLFSQDDYEQLLDEITPMGESFTIFDYEGIQSGDELDELNQKGNDLFDLGRYDEAISYYDRVLEIDPNDVVALNNKGYALSQLGKYDEALVHYNKALDIDPDYVLAQENKDIALEALSGKQESGGCLIATATFGSELAPQVQFLREIRDNTVLSTASGTSFMTAFNTFYYSFSPTIADLERQNPVFKETVKVAITPLLSSLSLFQYVDIDSETEMLGYGIGIILLNVGMYFVVPAFIIVRLNRYFISKISRTSNQI